MSEQSEPQSVESAVAPSVDQLNAWFEVLHRLSQFQFEDPLAIVTVPKPLRQDMRDCVDRGWPMAWEPQSGRPPDKLRLMIMPEGRAVYKEMCEELEAQGRPVFPCWVKSFG